MMRVGYAAGRLCVFMCLMLLAKLLTAINRYLLAAHAPNFFNIIINANESNQHVGFSVGSRRWQFFALVKTDSVKKKHAAKLRIAGVFKHSERE